MSCGQLRFCRAVFVIRDILFFFLHCIRTHLLPFSHPPLKLVDSRLWWIHHPLQEVYHTITNCKIPGVFALRFWVEWNWITCIILGKSKVHKKAHCYHSFSQFINILMCAAGTNLKSMWFPLRPPTPPWQTNGIALMPYGNPTRSLPCKLYLKIPILKFHIF